MPTGPPQNVRITALTSEHLIVSYSAPPTSQQNGIILTYTVEWGESTQVTSDVDVPTGSGLFHRVTGATPYTVYYARVAASTSIGRGPFSDWESARTLEAGEPSMGTHLCPFFRAVITEWIQIPFTNGDMIVVVNKSYCTLCWFVSKHPCLGLLHVQLHFPCQWLLLWLMQHIRVSAAVLDCVYQTHGQQPHSSFAVSMYIVATGSYVQ